MKDIDTEPHHDPAAESAPITVRELIGRVLIAVSIAVFIGMLLLLLYLGVI